MFALGSGQGIALLPDPAAEASGRTELSFEVGDIAGGPRPRAAQVAFSDYDRPDLQTVDHVCVLGADKAAWFTDPSGNVLCLHQPG